MHRYRVYSEKGDCERCGTSEKPTEHHVYPRRWNFKQAIQDKAIWLCLECHGQLEKRLDKLERLNGGRLSNWQYPHAALEFIAD